MPIYAHCEPVAMLHTVMKWVHKWDRLSKHPPIRLMISDLIFICACVWLIWAQSDTEHGETFWRHDSHYHCVAENRFYIFALRSHGRRNSLSYSWNHLLDAAKRTKHLLRGLSLKNTFGVILEQGQNGSFFSPGSDTFRSLYMYLKQIWLALQKS